MDQSVPQHGMSWTAHYFDRRLNSEGVSRACASKEDALRLTLAALAVVSPETVIRWHHAGFLAYWRSRSRPRGGRPKHQTAHSRHEHREPAMGRTADPRRTSQSRHRRRANDGRQIHGKA